MDCIEFVNLVDGGSVTRFLSKMPSGDLNLCALAEGTFADYQSQTKYHHFASEARLLKMWATLDKKFRIQEPVPGQVAAGMNLRRQSALIEDRWRRQFSVTFVPRSRNGVHFPPEVSNTSANHK